MKKLLLIFLIFFIGCSSTTLNCSKSNHSTIYGKETQVETYVFKNNKLTNYTIVKKIIFENNMSKYIDDVFQYYQKEINIIKENVKGSEVSIKKGSTSITTSTNIDIKFSDDTLEKLNIDKNLSINYVKKNLIEKGYKCEIED